MQKRNKLKNDRLSKKRTNVIRAAIEQVESRIFLSAFTPGDIVVYRVGTGTGSLSGVSTAVYLDEYSPTGTLVQSIPMPTGSSGANNPLSATGNGSSEGLLSLSQNGQNLLLTGYDAAPGSNLNPTVSISGATDATPAVFTTNNTVGMSNGDPVTVTFSGSGSTYALSPSQTTYYVGSLTSTTFSLYTTSALTTAVTGSGTFKSGSITDNNISVQRVVGVVSSSGAIDTSTTLGNLGNSSIYSASSVDGTSGIYVGSSNGSYYTTDGSTAAPTTLSTQGVYGVEVNGNQLYVSSTASGTVLSTDGTGLPTTAGQTLTELPGVTFSGTSDVGVGYSREFAFATLNPADTSPDTLYVADNYNDGIDKLSLVSGSWVLNGEIGQYPAGGTPLAGVTGIIAEPVQGGEQLFMTTGGKIYTVTDTTGFNQASGTLFSAVPPLTLVTSAASNEAFRGIQFVPQPGGAPTQGTNPASTTAVVGTNATFTASAYGVNVGVQWEVNTGTGFTPIAGATFDTLSLSSVTSGQSGNQYEAVFTNGSGTITSAPATLTVVPGPEFSFSTTAYTAPNTAGSVMITVNRFGDDSVADTVNYATSDGSAKAGTNYSTTNGTLTFPAGSTASQTFNVPLTYVASQSGPLAFNLTLSNVVGTNSGNAILGPAATFTITSPVETLTLGGTNLTGAISGATNSTPIVITTASTAGMVSGNSVFISGVGGDTNANGTYFVNVLSPTTFALYTNAGLTTGRAGNGTYTTGGTWSDNSVINYAVNDTDGTAVISALRAGSYTGDSGTLPFTYSGAVSGSGSFTFNAGELVSAASITLPAATTSNQSITVSIGTPTGFTTGGAILGTAQAGDITDIHAATTNQTSAAAKVTDIETSGNYSTGFAPVNGDTNAGTGSFGYLAYEVLEFSPTTSPTLYPVPGTTVNSNGISSLSLQMYNSDATGMDNYSGHIGNFNVYFLPDSDTTTPTSTLKFSTSVGPSGLASSQFTAAPVLLGTFSFNNTGGYDTYTPAAIPASVETVLVSDLNAGADFRLAVTPATSGAGAVAVDWDGLSSNTPILSMAAAETVNQVPEYISFSSASYSESEAGPATSITLTRSGPDSDMATVDYSTGGGDAVAGTNYTAATNVPVTFAAGSPTATFTIAPIDQANQGGDKFLNITLSSPSTGSSNNIGVLASPSAATLTIKDSSTAPTQTLTPTIAGAADVEEAGIYDDTEFKATAQGGGGAPYASFGVADFLPTAPTSTVTAIDSATLTATVGSGEAPSAGNFDIYLVSDNSSSIAVQNPESKSDGFYDPTQGIEGIGSQFGTKYLLGTYDFTNATIGATVTIPLTLSAAGEAQLDAALNNPASTFRIAITPEDSNVVADFQSTSLALSIVAQEGSKALTATSLVNNGSSTSNATQALSFTAMVSGGVPNGETVKLEDASNGNAVVATGTTSSGSVSLSVPAGTLLAGTHNLVAVYGGDSSFAPSQSAPNAQTVQVAVISVVINGNIPALSSVYGQPTNTTYANQRSMVDSIVYTFSEPVTLATTNAFTIAVHSGYTGTLPTLNWAAINPDGSGASTQWVVTFSGASVKNGSIADGVYDITLSTAAVTSEANPAGTVAPRATDTFYRLYGDVTGANKVTSADLNYFDSAYNLKSTQTGYLACLDQENPGKITSSDYNDLAANYLKKFSGLSGILTI